MSMNITRAVEDQALKIAKIEARRDIKVAQAGDSDYQYARLWRTLFVCLAVIGVVTMGVIGYSIYLPNERHLAPEEYEQCIEADKSWVINPSDSSTGSCV